jgi:hypothetical protein
MNGLKDEKMNGRIVGGIERRSEERRRINRKEEKEITQELRYLQSSLKTPFHSSFSCSALQLACCGWPGKKSVVG